MARHFIKDDKGKDRRNSRDERLFWSDTDGDSDYKHNQTVYQEHKGLFGGNSKVKSRFNPSTGKFRK
jgi:hypothetical protein